MKFYYITRCCRARYGTKLETVTFQGRTADFLWMMIFGAFTLLVYNTVPLFWTPFLGPSLVYMLLYLWSRENPTATIRLIGLLDFNIKAINLPWTMLCVDVIFGSSSIPGLKGMIAGHIYYFFMVPYPRATGKYLLKTPQWLHKLVACSRYLLGATNSTAPSNAERRSDGGAGGSG